VETKLRSLRSLVASSPELTCGHFAIIPASLFSPQKQQTSWRRGWDSNPRYGYPYNGFRDRSALLDVRRITTTRVKCESNIIFVTFELVVAPFRRWIGTNCFGVLPAAITQNSAQIRDLMPLTAQLSA
jgi:hypothetical protein